MKKLLWSLTVLSLMLSWAPSSRAEETPPTAEHKLGVFMMIVCGVSARLAPVAPVPFAGVAVVSCVAGCLDALTDPD